MTEINVVERMDGQTNSEPQKPDLVVQPSTPTKPVTILKPVKSFVEYLADLVKRKE